MFWLDFFKGQYTVTPEEKFTFDLEGYLVIKDVLSRKELDNLNAIADREFPRDYDDEAADSEFGNSRGVRRAPSVIDWDIACRHMLDHPKVLPYLTELLGPKFRLDHDYAIFMIKGGKRGSVHGGNPNLFHHYYKYQDGVMQCGLSVLTYVLSDAPAGSGGFACVRGSHKSNFRMDLPDDVRKFERVPHYVIQPEAKAGDAIFFTEALAHGTLPWCADHERRTLLYKFGPGHLISAPKGYDISEYEGLTERQKRILLAPGVHDRPDVMVDPTLSG